MRGRGAGHAAAMGVIEWPCITAHAWRSSRRRAAVLRREAELQKLKDKLASAEHEIASWWTWWWRQQQQLQQQQLQSWCSQAEQQPQKQQQEQWRLQQDFDEAGNMGREGYKKEPEVSEKDASEEEEEEEEEESDLVEESGEEDMIDFEEDCEEEAEGDELPEEDLH